MKHAFFPLSLWAFLSISVMCPAQQPPQNIIEIPVPDGFTKTGDKIQLPFQPLREEVTGLFTDQQKVGDLFLKFALDKRTQALYKPNDPSVVVQSEEIFNFYKTRLNARTVDNAGPVNVQNTYGHDLRTLQPGQSTQVLFFPSGFGGGIFEWYSFNKILKRFTITLGYSDLLLQEETYIPDKPISIPTAQEMGFPLYPGAEFRPLSSGFIELSENQSSYTMIFTTNDLPGKVSSYFKDKGCKPPRLLNAPNTFQIELPGVDWTLWPTLTIKRIPQSFATTPEGTITIPAYTEIRYQYLK